jgi:polyisoprenoid-binding protein YceI
MRINALALIVVVVALVVGAFAYSFFKPPAQATAPIESVAVNAPVGAADAAPTRRFEIKPEQSQARFVLDEVLQGTPKTVVGVTNQVAGQIAVDPADLDTAQIGQILINARTFATDSTQRDRMIQNRILQTEANEFISFQPKQVLGLPDGASFGRSVPFQIVGDLTIRGITREVTFDATVMPESPDRLQGKASTIISRGDYDLAIPQVPAVAGVSEQVKLELDFVAASG